MQKFSDYVALSIKDQLRSARYIVRHGARRKDSSEERTLFDLRQPVASVANAILSQAEAAASIFLADAEDEAPGSLFPLPVEAYFGHPDEEAARGRMFTRAFYNGLKTLLRKFSAGEFLIFEEAIEDARSALLLRHRDLIWTAIGARNDGQREERVTRLCAAIVCEVSAQRPIKRLDIDPSGRAVPKHLLIAPNAYCILVMGLATAMASLRRDLKDVDGDVIGMAADVVVDARFPRFSKALRDRDPVGALTREFAAVLPFLP